MFKKVIVDIPEQWKPGKGQGADESGQGHRSSGRSKLSVMSPDILQEFLRKQQDLVLDRIQILTVIKAGRWMK